MIEQRTFVCPKCNKKNTQFIDILPSEKDSEVCSECGETFYVFFNQYGDIVEEE